MGFPPDVIQYLVDNWPFKARPEPPLPQPPKEEPKVVRHMSERELREALDRHNAPLADRGVSCQCMECLYNRWYWKSQYNALYPKLPDWAWKEKIGSE